jgi:hemerythrin-like domain-containing protein
MCEYCGCRQIEPLAELMDEHMALLDVASDVEIALRHRDHERATAELRRLGELLDRHVRREEEGVFTALRATGEFLDEVSELEQEHDDFHSGLAALDPSDPELATKVDAMFRHLSDHIDKEDLGIFPVSVVTLGASGWDIVTSVHSAQPSFLAETARGGPRGRGTGHDDNA